MLGNFTCRQCRRTGRGENGYGTCHQNRPAKWRCGGRYQPDGSQRRNLLFCAAGSPRRIHWHFDVPVRSMVVPFGGAEIYYGTNPWPLPRREKATRSLPLIWRLPYRHGEKCSTPARVICLSRIPGRSIKTVYQQPIRSRYMLCSPPPGQRVWPDDDD